MAPQRTRKRKSEVLEEERDPIGTSTPTKSPATKKMKITQSQKQALIDNLQLEITERARHLRAHYALQANDLRSRIERRINRIPISLRKANMGALLAKYTEAMIIKEMPQLPNSTKALPAAPVEAQTRPLPSVPAGAEPPAAKFSSPTLPMPSRGTKRRSSEIAIHSDKNEPASLPDLLSNPKNPKRAKTGAAAAIAARTAKPIAPINVLSPKSHNSRTLPRSPIKDTNPPPPPPHPHPPPSPSKPSYIARPTSPLKPASPLKTAASAATSAISASLHGMVEQAKRGTAAAGLRRTASKEKAAAAANAKKTITTAATSTTTTTRGKVAPPTRAASQVSNRSAASSLSAVSTGTTVVTKKAVGKGKGKGNVALSGTTATNRKVTATMAATAAGAAAAKAGGGRSAAATGGKKVLVAEPAVGRRVLRKRN